jgi:shikimate kinase
MPKRIFLIGFMGSGKTTHGKKIARMIAYDFVDMDAWIVGQEGKSVPQLFADEGEAYFRARETDAIRELASREQVVIATGGGAPCHGQNIELMKEAGLVIYLKFSPAALLSRLMQSKTERPLLTGKSEPEMLETIEKLLAERETYYAQAHMITDGLDASDESVVNAIQRWSENSL